MTLRLLSLRAAALLGLGLLLGCTTTGGGDAADAGVASHADGGGTDAGSGPSCAAGETACGAKCCAPGETCSAAATCEPADGQLARCHAPASFPATAFASQASYLVDEDGYEYQANEMAHDPYRQSVSVALWPLSASTRLVGTFDLAKEPFDYSKCERCVLVTAGQSETRLKRYLAREGSLVVKEVNARRIAGELAGVQLAEVSIDEDSLATRLVPGGCTLSLPRLAFSYESPVVDERITRCFLPESFTPEQFRDYVFDYEANSHGYFYRAMETPAAAGIPNLTLFVEVYADGTGTFPLAGAERNCASCKHLVIIEAQAISGEMKSFVGSGGNLVLTELSETAMVGRLEDVVLVETKINGSTFTPVPGGCTTRIDALEFSSRNATP